MNHSLRNYFILLATLVIGVALVNLLPSPKVIDWTETYEPLDKIPYGTYILDNEIDAIFDKPVERYGNTPYEYFSEEKDSLHTRNLFFIHQYIDWTSFQKVLAQVEKGDTALFIKCTTDSDTLGIRTDNFYNSEADSIALSLTSQTNQDRKLSLERTYENYYFANVDTIHHKSLGYVHWGEEKRINFVEIPLGKGKIYSLLEAKPFTNYYLKNPQTRHYAQTVLGYLPKENKTIWFDDHFDGWYKEIVISGGEGNGTSGQVYRERRNILSVIFDYPELAMAWRLLLLGFVLYLIFQGKRRQRVIPVIEKPRNTTIEFAQTIGNLYFQEGDPYMLAQKKILYFLDAVRRKYYLDTQHLDEDFINRLIHKSGRGEAVVRPLINLIINIQRMQSASEYTLTNLDHLIEQFWNKTK